MAHALLFLGVLPAFVTASWMPARLERYAAGATGEEGVQRFSHQEVHELTDGGKLSLNWAMHVDPRTILSLDTESFQVELLECKTGRIVLRMPKQLADKDAKAWRFVVASHGTHTCQHIPEGEHMYSQIVRLEDSIPDRAPREGVVLFFVTEALDGHSRLAPYIHAEFRYSPAEASDLSLGRRPQPPRKLAVASTWGQPQLSTSLQGGVQETQSIFNFVPRQVSNFGWNWDFNENTQSNPEFIYKMPGGNGTIEFQKPCFRAHAAIVLNFTSEYRDIHHVPNIQLRLEMKGHAYINGMMGSVMNVFGDIDEDPFKKNNFTIPMVSDEVNNDMNLTIDPIKFNIGNIPVKFLPIVRVNLEAYHVGKFRGSIRVGLGMHCTLKAILNFETNKGLTTNFTSDMIHVTIWPPTWLINTRHFEMGATLEPSIWLNGSIGEIRDFKLGSMMKAYFNASVSRTGNVGAVDVANMKELAVYPFRVIGLPSDRRYAIKLGANGQYHMSSIQGGLDVIEYNDLVPSFSFGKISEHDLISNQIEVAILEDGQEPAVASGTAKIDVTAMVNGEVTPSPVHVHMNVNGKAVVVEITIVWRDHALTYLASKIRTLSVAIEAITLRPEPSRTYCTSGNQLSVRLRRNGRIYTSKSPGLTINRTNPDACVITGKDCFELGLSFLESWKIEREREASMPPNAVELLTPKIEIVQDRDNKVIAMNRLSDLSWDETGMTFMSGSQTFEASPVQASGAIPIVIPLYDPNAPNHSSTLGTGTMKVGVRDPAHASFWIFPYQAADCTLTVAMACDQHPNLIWTVEQQDDTIPLKFQLSTVLVNADGTFVESVLGAPFTQSCKYSPAELRKYHNYLNPCFFNYSASYPSVSVDDVRLLLLTWTIDGKTHKMYSAPMTFTALAAGRLFQIIGPIQGVTFDRKSALPKDLDVVWDRPGRSKHRLEQDREHMDAKGIPREIQENALSMEDEPPSMSVSIVQKGSGKEVYHQGAVATQDWWHRIPASVANQWEAGDYLVRLQWRDSVGEHKQEREVHVCDGCENMPTERVAEPAELRAERRLVDALSWSPMGASAQQSGNTPCSEADLKYSLGAGMVIKGVIEHIRLPHSIPVLGGLQEAPDFSTGWRSIEGAHIGDKLGDFFPPEICAMSVCQGTLPGCPPPVVHPLDIPKIRFTLSRDFLWTNDTPEKVRKIVAYALALVPEAIQITIHELGLRSSGTMTSSSNSSNGTRRLDGAKIASVFQATILEPVKFKVDKPLMRSLLATKSFDGMEDGREKDMGPVVVTGATLHYDSSTYTSQASLVVLSAALAVISLAAVFGALAFTRYRGRTKDYTPVADSAPQAA